MDELLFPQPYLPFGSKGPAVKLLQMLLMAMGYNDEIVPDGDYGIETEIAVKEFQDEFNLSVDGAFGPDSRAKFLEITGIDLNAIPYLQGETFVPEVEG